MSATVSKTIDKAQWAQWYPNGELNLGKGERLRFTTDADGDVVGAIHDHPRRRPADHPPDTGWHSDDFSCSSAIWFDVPEADRYDPEHARPRWHVVQQFPLTLTPSIACHTCGDHGFVSNGEWEPVP